MKHDLQIHTDSVIRLWEELAYIAEYLRSLGHTDASLRFGFAWYVAKDDVELSWKSARVPLFDLKSEIKQAEDAEFGTFTKDDVFVSVPEIEFQFCHHSGIHLFYSSPGPRPKHFHDRWQSLHLSPSEWTKADGSEEWKRVSDDAATKSIGCEP